MWTKPGYEPPPAKPAPEPSGETLIEFDRNNGNDRVRVAREIYENRPFVSIRLWSKGQDGQLYPTPKGATIRMRELGGLIAALQDVWQDEGQAEPPPPTPAPREQPASVRPPWEDDRPKFVERNPRPGQFDPSKPRPTPSPTPIPAPSDDEDIAF